MSRHVYEGPRWFRLRIRSRGPFLAIIPPAVLGAAALLVLRLFEGKLSGYLGLFLGVAAAPLAAGRRLPVQRSVAVVDRRRPQRHAVAGRRRRRGPPHDAQPDGRLARLLAHVLLARRRHLDRRRRRCSSPATRSAKRSSAARRAHRVRRSLARRHDRLAPGLIGPLLTEPVVRSLDDLLTPSPAGGSSPASPGRCRAPARGRRRTRTARWRRGGRRSPAPSPGRCQGARRARPPSPG